MLAKTISMRSGFHLSTCYHLLNTLVASGYVIKQPSTQRFVLTSKIRFTNRSPFGAAHVLPLLQPHVQLLRDTTRETAYLSLRDGDEIVVSAIVDSPRSLRVALLRVGYSNGNHAMALGKAILAYLDEQSVIQYLERHGMPALTTHTITSPNAFVAELATTRTRGYALDEEEFADETCCIAAPIFASHGRVIGSIGIAQPVNRYRSNGSDLIATVIDSAKAATRALALQDHLALS